MTDLSRLSDADLEAVLAGDMASVSDEGLAAITGEQAPVEPAPYGAGSELLSGLTFGFGDELRSMVTGEPLEAIQAGQEAYRQENPWLSTGLNIAGSLPTALIPGLGTANVLSKLGTGAKVGRTLGAATSGATYGGLTGAGEAAQGERAEGAKEGALFGAIAGPVGQTVGAVAPPIAQAVKGSRMSELLPQTKAQSMILGRLRAMGLTPEDAAQQLTEGKTIAELGQPLETIAGAVVRRNPQVGAQFQKLLDSRKLKRSDELLSIAEKEITSGKSPTMGQMTKFSRENKKAAGPLYEKAFAESEGIWSPRIDDLMTLEPFQAAYKRGQRIAKLEGRPIPDYEPGIPMTLRQADAVKKGLDGVIYGAKRDSSRDALDRTEIGLIDQLRGEFVGEIDKIAPEEYGAARRIYASEYRDLEAAEAGADAWKAGPEYVADFLEKASESERKAFAAGAFDDLRTRSAKLSDNREAARALFGNQRARQVHQMLSQVEGPSQIPDTTARQIAEADFANRMVGGSQTGARRAADEMLDMESIPERIAKRGPIGAAYDTALQKAVDLATTGRSSTVSMLGDMLLNPDMQQNRALLGGLSSLEEQMQRINRTKAATGTASAGLLGSQQSVER